MHANAKEAMPVGSPTQRVADKTAGACSISRSTMHQPWDRTTDPVAFPFWGAGGNVFGIWFLWQVQMWMTRNDVFRPGVKRSARLGARAPPAVLFAALIAGRSLAPSCFGPSACLVVWSLFVCHDNPAGIGNTESPRRAKKGGKPVLYMY